MAPKVEAMLTFLRCNPAGVGLITNPETIVRAIDGNGGNPVLPVRFTPPCHGEWRPYIQV